MPKKRTIRAVPKWIEAAFEAHAKRIFSNDDDSVAVEGIHEADRCWCCGARAKLQKCHIIPKALGGSAAPDNIVPMCARCHDEAPDVADSEALWSWIKSQQNGLSGVGHGRLNFLLDFVPEMCRKYEPTGPETESVEELLRHLMREQTNSHVGQFGQGAYIKPTTFKWAIEAALKRATSEW